MTLMNFMRRYGWYIFLAPSAIFVIDDYAPHDGTQQPSGLRRPPSTPLHSDGRRLQHELGHPGLSRRRRQMEAEAARDLPGLHGRRIDAPALLGAQHGRMAALQPSAAERYASRSGEARSDGRERA